ncbi:MAG: branched-chain-amino-acid transaminase [Candidatus Thiodiazotropha sp.]|jgi:branched-chain amino acid aminotransferase
MTQPVFWLNGRIVNAAEAMIPLTDHGLLYGDGVFEGIRFYNAKPFRLGDHLTRLALSARALMLELPYRIAELETAVAEVIEVFAAEDGYIRLVVTRGPGSLGLDPSRCERPNVFLIADRVALVAEEKRRHGIELITASTRRPGPTVLDPRIKSLNYLNNILAKLEARRAGADEALLLNERGYVTEGTAENIFIVRGGGLYTPPVSDGALDGITRGVVLELSRQEGIESIERSLTPYDVHTADECFLCGTGAELLPVRAVDGRQLACVPGPITERIRDAFGRLIEAETVTGSEQ